MGLNPPSPQGAPKVEAGTSSIYAIMNKMFIHQSSSRSRNALLGEKDVFYLIGVHFCSKRARPHAITFEGCLLPLHLVPSLKLL